MRGILLYQLLQGYKKQSILLSTAHFFLIFNQKD
jgi:hypothetical protein